MTYIEDLAARVALESDGDFDDPVQRPLYLLYAVLVLAKGEATTRRDVHDAWVAWMAMRGEEHESMTPFESLSDAVQDEDDPYVAAIRRVARSGMRNAVS